MVPCGDVRDKQNAVQPSPIVKTTHPIFRSAGTPGPSSMNPAKSGPIINPIPTKRFVVLKAWGEDPLVRLIDENR